MLGNLAVDNDLKLTVRIRFIAEVDEDAPYTGDNSSVMPWALAAGGSLVLICVLLVLKKRERKEEE